MFGLGLGLLGAAKWFARNDAAWLSRVIEGALASPGESGSPATGTQNVADERAVPLTLKGMAIFLAASGAMAVVSGLIMTDCSTTRVGRPIFLLCRNWAVGASSMRPS